MYPTFPLIKTPTPWVKGATPLGSLPRTIFPCGKAIYGAPGGPSRGALGTAACSRKRPPEADESVAERRSRSRQKTARVAETLAEVGVRLRRKSRALPRAVAETPRRTPSKSRARDRAVAGSPRRKSARPGTHPARRPAKRRPLFAESGSLERDIGEPRSQKPRRSRRARARNIDQFSPKAATTSRRSLSRGASNPCGHGAAHRRSARQLSAKPTPPPRRSARSLDQESEKLIDHPRAGLAAAAELS